MSECQQNKAMKILGPCRSDSVPGNEQTMSWNQEEALLTIAEWNLVPDVSGKSKDGNCVMHIDFV